MGRDDLIYAVCVCGTSIIRSEFMTRDEFDACQRACQGYNKQYRWEIAKQSDTFLQRGLSEVLGAHIPEKGGSNPPPATNESASFYCKNCGKKFTKETPYTANICQFCLIDNKSFLRASHPDLRYPSLKIQRELENRCRCKTNMHRRLIDGFGLLNGKPLKRRRFMEKKNS